MRSLFPQVRGHAQRSLWLSCDPAAICPALSAALSCPLAADVPAHRQRLLSGQRPGWTPAAATLARMPQPWPWPGDSREERAKRIALSYRQRLEAVDGHAVAELDAFWLAHGAHWVQPARAPLDLDEWLTPADMADKLHIESRALRDWARRNRIRVIIDHGVRKYCVGDVIEYMRQTRLRRVSSTLSP